MRDVGKQMIILRFILIGLIVLGFAGCAARFSSIPVEKFDSTSRLFVRIALSEKEQAEIVSEFKKAAGGQKFIYEVFMETPERIQVLTLDQRKMEYGMGRTYYFKKTSQGWRFDSSASIDYWSVCQSGQNENRIRTGAST